MKSARTGLFVLVVVAMALLLGAVADYFATGRGSAAATTVAQPLPDSATPSPAYRELSNGVYYFSVVGDEYVSALEEFYEDNPTLHCDYQGAAEGYGLENYHTNGHIIGHILHCHDLAVPAQDVTVP